ncbi:MAG TPA: hypothetical protein ENN44_07975 [Methanoculleus sp.]|nr:hypothetical protein [Methanoculleus sp.]
MPAGPVPAPAAADEKAEPDAGEEEATSPTTEKCSISCTGPGSDDAAGIPRHPPACTYEREEQPGKERNSLEEERNCPEEEKSTKRSDSITPAKPARAAMENRPYPLRFIPVLFIQVRSEYQWLRSRR